MASWRHGLASWEHGLEPGFKILSPESQCKPDRMLVNKGIFPRPFSLFPPYFSFTFADCPFWTGFGRVFPDL
jgi:hypothetical protein